ncbi:penicillin-binding protein 2 [Arhodomonas aquaeolei]|uniref:penicillin-binding protein 2 n=1 Tax=Arhodomonas aquaeolei TaxID=2369 RepID=UPI00216791C9|nr:penicillin-binding protein 2 [Arhodomonas aquaeolei]MCS4505523.1 penicillin-binding protein 2 [Arhodomonas aquaeolei]
MTVQQLQDPVRERRLVRSRLVVAALAVLAAVGVLAGRMWWLQVAGYQHYATLSQENRVRVVGVPPTRGLIYDRNGVLLAENVPTYRLVVTPEQVSNMDNLLTRIRKVVSLRPTDLERFHELRRQRPGFQEIPLKFDLTEKEVARLAVNRHRFPGVEVKAQLTRNYPLGSTAVHAVGYVGRINQQELSGLSAAEYSATSHIGKTGIERYYEKRLHGHVGVKRVETNAMGRTLRVLDRDPPVPGEDLQLSLDVRLQKVAEGALGEESGAIVAIDPQTGELLAMASTPTFDPNLFVNGISLEDYRSLQQGKDKPLFNRVLRGQYPPGSTIKPFMGLAGLETGTTTPEETIYDPGYYSIPGVDHRWRCWKRGGHGTVNMHDAIEESCDTYFYDLAYKMGINAMHDFLLPFGIGRSTGVDLSGELSGLMPSKEWKRRVKGKPWYHGETIIAGIGQGYMLTTPLQLAYATATMANRGKRLRPHLLRSATGPDGKAVPVPDPHQRPPIQLDKPQRWETIIDAMHDVVQGPRGTARRVGRGAPYQFAGKTGTAQVFGIDKGEEYDAEELAKRLRDHALFISFAPLKDPKIAVAVVVENGGGGSSTAAPMARTVMDAWLLRLRQTAQGYGDE